MATQSEQCSFGVALNYAMASIGVDFGLREKQIECLRALFEGKDTIAVLPTGFGKSTIFHLLPWLLQLKYGKEIPMIVLVICPLNSIMEDQVQTLSERGIQSCFLNIEGSGGSTYALIKPKSEDRDDETYFPGDEDYDNCYVYTAKHIGLSDIKSGRFNLVYTHPETVIRSKGMRKILQSSEYQSRVCCTVLMRGDEFRTAFKKLGELTCIFPKIAHLAVTATATPSAVNKLTEILQFDKVTKVTRSPDRPNIYINRKSRLPNLHKYAKYDDILNQVVPSLKTQGNSFPVTIVYVENLDALGYAYQFTEDYMGEDAYNQKEKRDPEHRVFAQYHKDYPEAMKRHIVCELRKPSPTLRLVFATVALGMGLNSPCITNIVHFQPPTTLEKYMQEIGRAGRKGQLSTATFFFNSNDIATNRVGLSEHVKPFCTTNLCLRKHLVNHFGFESESLSERCCSNCQKDEVECTPSAIS